MPHHWSKLPVEEMLFSSALDVTILQPTAYMQNCLSEWDRMVGSGIYRVPYPVETRLSLVDLDDVAEAAAIVLSDADHSGATYELVGTPPLSQTRDRRDFSATPSRSPFAPKPKPPKAGTSAPARPAWTTNRAKR